MTSSQLRSCFAVNHELQSVDQVVGVGDKDGDEVGVAVGDEVVSSVVLVVVTGFPHGLETSGFRKLHQLHSPCEADEVIANQ